MGGSVVLRQRVWTLKAADVGFSLSSITHQLGHILALKRAPTPSLYKNTTNDAHIRACSMDTCHVKFVTHCAAQSEPSVNLAIGMISVQ